MCSLISDSLCAVDRTIVETFMKFQKRSGGLLGIFEQYSAYQRWCQTTFERAGYYEEARELCGLLDDLDVPKEDRHQELHQSLIKESEAATLKVVSATQSFTNPWRVPDKNRLHSLTSEPPVSIDVENDVLGAEDLGRSLKEQFINRFKVGSKFHFNYPVKGQNLRTMEAAGQKAKLTTSQGKLVQFQKQSDLAFTLFLTYSLAPVPHYLGTLDGFFVKTNKASMLHFLMKDNVEEVKYPIESVFIQDGNALFHFLIC